MGEGAEKSITLLYQYIIALLYKSIKFVVSKSLGGKNWGVGDVWPELSSQSGAMLYQGWIPRIYRGRL